MKTVLVLVGGLQAIVGPPAASPRRAAKVGGEPPEWICIFEDGEHAIGGAGERKESWLCDAEARAQVIATFIERGNDLVIDYEHQTLDSIQAPAAGWIKELEDRGEEGLWARVEWTERAREYIRAGEYRYFSPVYDVDKETRRVTQLHHVAITNWPSTHNLTALTEQIAAKARARFGSAVTAKEEVSMESLLEQLRWLLGLPITATHNEVRTGLGRILDVIPADDAMLVEAKEGETPQTFAEALSVAIAASEETGQPGTEHVEVAIVASKAVLEELELEEGATLAQVHARIGELRSPTGVVAASEHQAVVTERNELRDRLAQLEGKSDAEALDRLIASNRSKITPAKEPWFRKIAAKHGVAHAAEIAREMKDELPDVSAASAPPSPETIAAKEEIEPEAPKTRRVGDRDIPVDPASAARAAKVRSIQAEDPKLSYREADEELTRRERGA